MIKIGKFYIDEIKKHGAADYPFECCGILIGILEEDKSKTVKEILPVSNSRDEKDKHNRFLITPDELLKGELAARRKKFDVIGFYHSHPDHPAAPSEFDRDNAWPVYSYIIVSVTASGAGDFFSWELKNDRSGFSPEHIIEGD